MSQDFRCQPPYVSCLLTTSIHRFLASFSFRFAFHTQVGYKHAKWEGGFFLAPFTRKFCRRAVQRQEKQAKRSSALPAYRIYFPPFRIHILSMRWNRLVPKIPRDRPIDYTAFHHSKWKTFSNNIPKDSLETTTFRSWKINQSRSISRARPIDNT